jgi:hypothetical protein
VRHERGEENKHYEPLPQGFSRRAYRILWETSVDHQSSDPTLRNSRQELLQHVYINWLNQMVVEPHLLRALAV